MAEEPPEKISKPLGIQLSENLQANNYPEFENYQYVGNLSDFEEQDKKVSENSFSSKFKKFFGKVEKEVKSAAGKIKDKFIKLQLGDKIKTTGKKFIVVMKDAEGFIVMKSQPVVDKISEKSKIGYKKISAKTKEVYKKLTSKIFKKENPTEKLLEETQQNSNYYELKTNHQNQLEENNAIKFLNEEEKKVEAESSRENKLTYVDFYNRKIFRSSEIVEANIKYEEKQGDNLIKGNNSFMLFSNSVTSENEGII